mgnify:CR=1 FL=1
MHYKFFLILRFTLDVGKRRKCLFVRHANQSESAFIFPNILFECTQQTLGMFGCQNYARLHASLWHSRHHADKVENKFRTGMSYNSQIGICTLRHFFLQFYLELTVVDFLDFPCCTIVFKMFLKDRPKVLFFFG